MNRRRFFGIVAGAVPATAVNAQSASAFVEADYWCVTCENGHAIFQYRDAADVQKCGLTHFYGDFNCGICGNTFSYPQDDRLHFRTGWRQGAGIVRLWPNA